MIIIRTKQEMQFGDETLCQGAIGVVIDNKAAFRREDIQGLPRGAKPVYDWDGLYELEICELLFRIEDGPHVL